ncbi:MAG: MBL fold metallo-hydrolase [Gemmatimonadetes bacterium]|nr:MBL fold metallo-hydrolase [Gemmatimonadota bacterium]
MSKRGAPIAGLIAVLAWVWPVGAQDASSVLAAASRAMGVEALRTVRYTATGFDFALGQSGVPGAPWPKFINRSYTRSVDFQASASQVDRVRAQGEIPPYGGGLQPIQGDQPQSQTIVAGPSTPWVQQLEIFMLPHGFLRAAASRNPSLRRQGAYSVVSFRGENGAQVSGWINAQNQVERVETMIDNAVMGDMPFEAIYSDYRATGGVQFPMRIVQKQGGFPIFDLTVGDVTVNAPVNIQAPQAGGRGGAPAGRGAAGAGGGRGGAQAAASTTPSEQIAPGVYLFTGGYAPIAVDMGDHILFLEAGNNEARAQAVIAEAKRLMPNKPVRYVVATHHHFDHASGLRAFVAEGATILTHDWNAPYFRDVFARPHTLNPDAQQRAQRPLQVQGVGDRHVITGNGHTIELHRLMDFGHTPGMLVAYFPQHRVLYEADSYNPPAADAPPPATPSPYNQALLANIERLRLSVDRIVATHYPADGRVVTVAELRRMVGAN